MTVISRPPLAADLLKSDAFINGAFVPAASGRRFAVHDPGDGTLLAEVADCDQADALEAVRAADAAFPRWRAALAKERAKILRAWFDLILTHQEALARILTSEQGKPLAEARGEVAYGASFIEWFAEEGKRVYGDIIPAHLPGRRIQVTKQPIGVVSAITPWNFPIAMITRKVAPALAAGCPVVVKPAQDTPLSALALAALAEQAGMPAGVFSVVPCLKPDAVGTVLTEDPRVRKVSFTGSTPVGKRLMAAASKTVKKVSLELGGNAPFLVFDDADLDAAVAGAIASKYRNAGQTCVCANRILVQDGVHDAFVEKLVRAVSAFKVGHGLEEGVTQGPLINQAAIDKVERLVGDALSKGAEVAIGGGRHERGGTFWQPTVLLGARPEMQFAQDEIFGPVAPIYRFKTEDEAIAMANDTVYGLAAYFYARDIGRVERVAEGLDYGIVGINEGIISTEVAPFGGMKESGLGREGSKYGMDDFLEIKYRCLGGLA